MWSIVSTHLNHSISDTTRAMIPFDWFWRTPNPTQSWTRSACLELDFDLESARLNSVALGDSLNAASFLGPCEDSRWLANEEYGYESLGLRLSCEQGRVDSMEIHSQCPEWPKYRSFAGRVRYGSRHFCIAELTEGQFVREFGTPFWRDQDKDEIILFYELPGREWQVEFLRNGDFKCMTVTSNALLARLEQRLAYGVSKPWPPVIPAD